MIALYFTGLIICAAFCYIGYASGFEGKVWQCALFCIFWPVGIALAIVGGLASVVLGMFKDDDF